MLAVDPKSAKYIITVPLSSQPKLPGCVWATHLGRALNSQLARDAASEERMARASPTKRAAFSISSREVNRPKLKRMEASLFVAFRPSARSTCDGSGNMLTGRRIWESFSRLVI